MYNQAVAQGTENYDYYKLMCPIQNTICEHCGLGNCSDALPEIEGCTDSNADNYNPEANTDDGSCEYCAEFESLPYSQQFGNCNTYNNWESYSSESLSVFPEEQLEIIYSNLISVVGPNGMCCKNLPDPISGCTDSTALNYNPEAYIDDNSCQYMKYNCSTCDGCVEDPNGPFSTMEECNNSAGGCVPTNINTFFNNCPGPQCGGFPNVQEFCNRCNVEYESTQEWAQLNNLPNCDCCQNVIITGDPEGLPSLSPLPPKDPVKDKMQKLAGIKPEKK